MQDWRTLYQQKLTTAEEAVKHIKSGDRVVVAHATGEPILLTEFGGISMRNDTEGAWGYTNAGSSEELLAEYRRILQAINDSQALYGFCYTQLCDVEQETNGLYTYDRRPKVAPDAIRRINESVKGF